MSKYALFAIVLAMVLTAYGQEEDVGGHGGGSKRRPFCPSETEKNKKCLSRPNAYKCAAFFEGLSGTDEPISWLGAMPDALRKKRTRENKKFLRSFGLPVYRRSFLLRDKCSDLTANSRCYVIMQKASMEPLDSCEESILNETGGRPVGDKLCAKAAKHAGDNREQFNITIGFYFSACGGPWSQTKDSLTNPEANPLVVKERLCCKPDEGGKPRYYRCDGGEINKSCTQKEDEVEE